jgi:signal transduction histidine kinase
LVPRAFGRTQEQAREALERLPHELAGTEDLPQAQALFLERVRAIAGSRPATLHLRHRGGQLPWEGIPELGLMLSDGMSETPAQSWLAKEEIEVLIPVGTSSGLIGALTLGSGSGSLPPARDLEALQTAAAAMGATVSHRMAVDTIIGMNRELEVLVERRTEERDEARLKSFRWERVAALSTLSAGIGHELASPLGVALSSMDQVMRNLEKERYDRVERFARLSLDGVRRASEIVRNLQIFSQPGIDRLQRFDPSQGIELSLRLLQKRMDRKEIQVEVEGVAPKLRGYPVLVHQVVYNLLHNAVKMSPQGGVVQLNFSQDETNMRLEVVDQGPGVPEELRRTLFDPFETTQDDATASGLGLSLCASFVTLHGGGCYQEDPPEGGARFVIELPLEGPPEGDQAGVLQGLSVQPLCCRPSCRRGSSRRAARERGTRGWRARIHPSAGCSAARPAAAPCVAGSATVPQTRPPLRWPRRSKRAPGPSPSCVPRPGVDGLGLAGLLRPAPRRRWSLGSAWPGPRGSIRSALR